MGTTILVHLPKSWPKVLSGDEDAAFATLGNWSIAKDRLTDVEHVLGVFRNTTVSAYDVTSWSVVTDGPDKGRITFAGRPSRRWGKLIGTPSPRRWVQGQSWPVQTIDTDELVSGSAPVETVEGDGRRAVIDGLILDVPEDRDIPATLVVPQGRRITVVAS